MKRRIQRNMARWVAPATRIPAGINYVHSGIFYRGAPHAYGYCGICGCAMNNLPQPVTIEMPKEAIDAA